ncbi:MAG: HEAT repeat domain-containing protein [Candidatus Synoicihabitans palmerolidicus]|nr:HEAT repeat domain-containing protein [Candidatus Synoicihabitans palmerolidicus]
MVDTDSEVRAQAAKLAGDHHDTSHYATLIKLLSDEEPRVRFFAAQSLGKLDNPEAAPALLELLRRNADSDPAIRHAASYALSRLHNRAALALAESDESPAVRLDVILAYRLLQDAQISSFLLDRDPYLVREAALAINDAPINDALPALAALRGSGRHSPATPAHKRPPSPRSTARRRRSRRLCRESRRFLRLAGGSAPPVVDLG